MPRFLATVALVACGVGCMPTAAPHAPVPPDAGKPPYYFPTRVATKWVYDHPRHEGFAKIVTESVEKNGRYLVTVKTTSVDWVDTAATTISRYEVSRAGVFLVAQGLESEDNREEFDPPYRILKLPHKAGEKWDRNQKGNEQIWVTGEIETVKVPAGTFEAIRVDRREGDDPCSIWFAPGVGIVKNAGKTPGIELKSFTLPKE